jgi:hypothetical protein
MGKKRTGAERLVPTSVQIEAGVLDRIDALGYHQSTFLRDAANEKLEREEGYLGAIEVQGAIVDKILEQAEKEQLKLHELHEKHKEWKAMKQREIVKDAVVTEYFTGFHKTKESLLTAMKHGLKTELDLEEIVEEVWKEVQIE